jgi:hypothetical protein
VASRLIGYQDRLWLANSVKGVNHNSADLYSYDPDGGALRYERHLFSQDAGRPVVADGLLYWPFEDATSPPPRTRTHHHTARDLRERSALSRATLLRPPELPPPIASCE